MRYIIFILVLLICSTSTTNAQINIGGIPHSWKDSFVQKKEIPVYATGKLNLKKLTEEDEQDELDNVPPRFGYKHKVNLTTENAGIWTELPNGDKIWQLKLFCPEATSINLTYSKFWLPPNGKLHIYSEDKSELLGAFTEQNNKGTLNKMRGFGSGFIFNEKVVLEYYQDKRDKKAIIEIEGIIHGYENIHKDFQKGFGDSGTCQVDVNCSPEGDSWQDEKTGIAIMVIDGNRRCSGSMVNNTCNNGDLLFLTAEHCIDSWAAGLNYDAISNNDLSSSSFIWNYEIPNCNNLSDTEPPIFMTNGATLLANNDDFYFDFALLRLTESPLELVPQQNIAFNGWDLSNNQSSGGVCIHHPRLDVKKILTFDHVPISNTNCATNPDGVELQNFNIDDYWEINPIETTNGHSIVLSGSSGSPLFNNEKYIIGVLSGFLYCVEAFLEECDDNIESVQPAIFQRISTAWNSNPIPERQLEFWLNPCGLNGATSLDGGYIEFCDDNVSISQPIVSNSAFEANQTITASSTVASTVSAEMVAGQEVILSPNFLATNGCDYIAHIEPCQPEILPLANKKSNTKQSILENANFSTLNIFPNPANDIVSIEFELSEDSDVEIMVTDISGRTMAVYENTHKTNTVFQTQVSTSNFPNGTYLITLLTHNYTESKKLIIIR